MIHTLCRVGVSHAASPNAVHGDHLDHQAVLDAHHTHNMVIGMHQAAAGGSCHSILQHIVIATSTWGCQHGHNTYTNACMAKGHPGLPPPVKMQQPCYCLHHCATKIVRLHCLRIHVCCWTTRPKLLEFGSQRKYCFKQTELETLSQREQSRAGQGLTSHDETLASKGSTLQLPLEGRALQVGYHQSEYGHLGPVLGHQACSAP